MDTNISKLNLNEKLPEGLDATTGDSTEGKKIQEETAGAEQTLVRFSGAAKRRLRKGRAAGAAAGTGEQTPAGTCKATREETQDRRSKVIFSGCFRHCQGSARSDKLPGQRAK